MEKFKIIILDFEAVEMVGQGFCDEIFRVWKKKNPQVEIVPINMGSNVEFMVKRALRSAEA